MPTEKWLVRWKTNRNHKGEEIVFSRKKADILAEEKRFAGFKKIWIEKLPRNTVS